MTVMDLEKQYYARSLGLDPNTMTVANLEALFLAGAQYGIANNRRFAFNKYYGPENPGGNSTVAAPVLNDLNVFPFVVGKQQAFDRLALAVTTVATAASGAVVRLGLYDTASNGDPQNLLASVGPFSTESLGTKEGAIAVTLNPGLYWVGAVAQVSVAGPPAFRAISAAWSPFVSFDDPANSASGCGYLTAGVAGALPSPFPISHANAGIYSGSLHRVMLRAA